MKTPDRKTPAEHLEFAEAASRLAFWFAFSLKMRGSAEPLEFILRERTPLYHVALGLDPEIPLDIFSGLPEAGSASEFEEKMWRRCCGWIRKRAAEQYPQSLGMGLHGVWQCESLKYDPPHKDSPEVCHFHIGNGRAPGSIFDDPDYLPEKLLELMERSGKEFGYVSLATSSWLNSYPRWLALFPEEWRKNLTPRDPLPLWHLGYWGQIVTSRGVFHEKTGKFIRENLVMRYPFTASHGSFESIKQFLKGKIK